MLPTKISRDRRSRRRYPIHLPVHFKVIKNRLVTCAGTGKVINMSSGAIAFRSNETFHVGTLMQLSISWFVLLDDKIPIKLVAEGRVLRSDGQVAAVEIFRHDFHIEGKSVM